VSASAKKHPLQQMLAYIPSMEYDI